MALSLKKVKRAPVIAKDDFATTTKSTKRSLSKNSDSLIKETEIKKDGSDPEILPERAQLSIGTRPWSEVVVREKDQNRVPTIKQKVADKIVTHKTTDENVTHETTDEIVTHKTTDEIVRHKTTDEIVTNAPVDLTFFEQRQSINRKYSSSSTLRAWCEVLRIGVSS